MLKKQIDCLLISKNKKANFKWSDKLAYCVGLLVSDGNLSKDGRHIVFVSKDKDSVETFKACLNLKNKISVKGSGYNRNGRYYFIQFGNINFYHWLNKIGIKSNKSKTIGSLRLSQKYFFSFLRGVLDGDGCLTSFKHPESQYPQIRIKFTSGSKNFLIWLRNKINRSLDIIKGKIEKLPRGFQLIYYKNDSIDLLKKIYEKSEVCLNRKFLKAKRLLSEENKGGWWNWKTREA